MESGYINIARANQSAQYPAEFMLITACNPCKCGYLADGTERCQCSANSIENYRAKLSGPLLDRIDMHVHLPRVDLNLMQNTDASGESSNLIKQRVTQARALQLKHREKLNSQLSSKEVEGYCAMDKEKMDFLISACEKLNMSARSFHRVLKLSRTIADMAGEEGINKAHLLEAVGFRSLDRR